MRARPVHATLHLLLLCFIVSLTAALADEWAPPEVKTYYSQDSHVRLTVTPRGIQSPLRYFEGKVENETQAGQQQGGSPFVRGVLERKGGDGRWITVWDKELVNDVSPVSALVTNSARYVVTFDNWHSMGWGNDVVVIYGANGSAVRSLSLYDILPSYYVKALPHSVSSIWWSGSHHIFEPSNILKLNVVIPSEADDSDRRRYVEISLRLATGEVLPVTDAAWQNALTDAAIIAKKLQAADDAWFAEFKAPLLGPKDDNWDHYLYEAFSRLDPEWRDNQNPTTVILPSPDAKEYQQWARLLRGLLLETPPSSPTILIASPASNENLVKLLGEIVHEAKQDTLKDRRIYVAVPAEYRERIAAIFVPAGATFIHLDPAKPIPQRQERIDDYLRGKVD